MPTFTVPMVRRAFMPELKENDVAIGQKCVASLMLVAALVSVSRRRAILGACTPDQVYFIQ